jgi:hypothetical protein
VGRWSAGPMSINSSFGRVDSDRPDPPAPDPPRLHRDRPRPSESESAEDRHRCQSAPRLVVRNSTLGTGSIPATPTWPFRTGDGGRLPSRRAAHLGINPPQPSRLALTSPHPDQKTDTNCCPWLDAAAMSFAVMASQPLNTRSPAAPEERRDRYAAGGKCETSSHFRWRQER